MIRYDPTPVDLISNFFVLCTNMKVYLYPRYEVYRGYIVFAFSVIMFVCLSVCFSNYLTYDSEIWYKA